MKTNYILKKSGEVTQTIKNTEGRVAMHDLVKYILSSAVHCPDLLKGLTVYKQDVDANGEEVWCEPFMQFSSPEIIQFLKVFKDFDKSPSPQEIVYDNQYPQKI